MANLRTFSSSGLLRLFFGLGVGAAAAPQSEHIISQTGPVAVVAVVALDASVVAVPLHPVTVVQEVEVIVETVLLPADTKDETETTCVQDGYAELSVHVEVSVFVV